MAMSVRVLGRVGDTAGCDRGISGCLWQPYGRSGEGNFGSASPLDMLSRTFIGKRRPSGFSLLAGSDQSKSQTPIWR